VFLPSCPRPSSKTRQRRNLRTVTKGFGKPPICDKTQNSRHEFGFIRKSPGTITHLDGWGYLYCPVITGFKLQSFVLVIKLYLLSFVFISESRLLHLVLSDLIETHVCSYVMRDGYIPFIDTNIRIVCGISIGRRRKSIERTTP